MTDEELKWIKTNNSVCALLKQVHDVLALTSLPTRRKWVGLTAEDINQFETWFDEEEERKGWVDPALIAKYFEAKLKEKNA
jgi:hypothetical protein